MHDVQLSNAMLYYHPENGNSTLPFLLKQFNSYHYGEWFSLFLPIPPTRGQYDSPCFFLLLYQFQIQILKFSKHQHQEGKGFSFLVWISLSIRKMQTSCEQQVCDFEFFVPFEIQGPFATAWG